MTIVVVALVGSMTRESFAQCRISCMPDETHGEGGCCVLRSSPNAGGPSGESSVSPTATEADVAATIGCASGQSRGPLTEGHCC